MIFSAVLFEDITEIIFGWFPNLYKKFVILYTCYLFPFFYLKAYSIWVKLFEGKRRLRTWVAQFL